MDQSKDVRAQTDRNSTGDHKRRMCFGDKDKKKECETCFGDIITNEESDLFLNAES